MLSLELFFTESNLPDRKYIRSHYRKLRWNANIFAKSKVKKEFKISKSDVLAYFKVYLQILTNDIILDVDYV